MQRRPWFVRLLLFVVVCLVLAGVGPLTCSRERHEAIGLNNQGIDAFNKQQKAAAIRALEAAVAADPSYLTARYNLAKVMQDVGRWQEATPHLRHVIAAEPENALAYYDLGRGYQMLEAFTQAAEALDKALALKDRLYAAHYRRGMVALAQGQPELADRHYRQAIAANPRFAPPFASLALLYLDRDDPDRARQVLSAGVAVNEDEAGLYALLGVAYQQLAQYADAVTSLERALKLKPELHESIFNLGMAYAALGQAEKARAVLQRFVHAAEGRRGVDPSYLQAAHEKMWELSRAAD